VTRVLDVCIVTADIVGPIRNGGIGTAYYNLAHALARAGHRVTVLYALGSYCENGTIRQWIREYKRAGITLVPMPSTPVETHAAMRMAHGVYEWLKTRHFDIVHCHEWRGIGFFTALGKRQGLCLRNSVLCVGAHSPVMWCHEGMNDLADHDAIEVDFMERQSVALADVLWTPSQHMRDWLTREGWALPERVLHLPYILLDLDKARGRAARPGAHLVFFGRLETRKGLDLFCDALDRLVKRGTPPPRVTFLGKLSRVDGMPTDEYLRERSAQWPFPWKIVDDLDRDGAMTYLRGPNRVAVLPSKLDNLPYTVLECLAGGIPFVASNIGGIPEMIPPADRERVLFDLTAASMADRLGRVLAVGLKPAPLAVPAETILAQWLDWHLENAPARTSTPRRTQASRFAPLSGQPLVSVCVTTRNRPAFLAAALDSIRKQDYPHIEVVVVDDGSDMPEAHAHLEALAPEFDRKQWQILRQPNRYVGAARNAAIGAARGDYLLFMDDDNLAVRSEVSTFVRAAVSSGADVLTCLMNVFQSNRPRPARTPERIWPFLGGALVPGLLRNVFGDANGFFHRSVFERIGGFSEDFGVGAEDWEMYARAVLRGLTVQVVPEPLVWYRQSSQGMLNTTSMHANRMRALRPYFALLPAHLRPLVHLSHNDASRPAAAPAGPAPARLDHVQRAVIFGTGEAGRMALDLAGKCGWTVPWLVDNNPSAWNREIHGKPVRQPHSLQKDGVDLVIIASLAGKPAISKQLEKMGLSAGEHFVHFLDPVRVGTTVYQIALS